MDNSNAWIDFIISLIGGIIGGGITANFIINKKIVKQKSKGDNSPNIGGSANNNQFGK